LDTSLHQIPAVIIVRERVTVSPALAVVSQTIYFIFVSDFVCIALLTVEDVVRVPTWRAAVGLAMHRTFST